MGGGGTRTSADYSAGDNHHGSKFKKYSPIRETTDDEKHSSEQYSSGKFDESGGGGGSLRITGGGKHKTSVRGKGKLAPAQLDASSSGISISNSGRFNAIANQFSKHVSDFIKEGKEEEEEEEDDDNDDDERKDNDDSDEDDDSNEESQDLLGKKNDDA
jgi:hypothetical protein